MLRKHSVSIRGHRTSFSLEDEFWDEFRKIAEKEKVPLAKLITQLDEDREPDQNLSSTLRVFVLMHIKQANSSRD
ncbi:MAG: ribbon-helix-helix domain-containing protein [Pseudomonadota bacterium]